MHKCMGACQTKLGRGRFDKNQWDYFLRKRSKTIVCISCLKAEDARERRITATLRQKDAWKCIPKRCTESFHAEQCPLNPIKHTALPVWRGKNKGISLDDLEFLKKRPRNWEVSEDLRGICCPNIFSVHWLLETCETTGVATMGLKYEICFNIGEASFALFSKNTHMIADIRW